jgi:hypothetical protein
MQSGAVNVPDPYTDVCWRRLTYADVCWRMLTKCSRALSTSQIRWRTSSWWAGTQFTCFTGTKVQIMTLNYMQVCDCSAKGRLRPCRYDWAGILFFCLCKRKIWLVQNCPALLVQKDTCCDYASCPGDFFYFFFYLHYRTDLIRCCCGSWMRCRAPPVLPLVCT